MKKTLLLFGVSGFTGTHLGRYLQKNVPEVNLNVIGVISSNQEVLFDGIHHLEVVDALDDLAVLELIGRIKPETN